MKTSYNINGKKNIESSSKGNLQKILKKNGCKSVKLGCTKGTCGNCMILLNDLPVPSCKISFSMIKPSDKIVTLSYFQRNYPEAKDINKGFEKAGINLCGYCDSGKIFTAYDLIKKGKPSKEKIFNAVSTLNTCCTDAETLCEGILYAYDFKVARKQKELKNENPVQEQFTQKKEELISEQNIQFENRTVFPTSMQNLFEEIEKHPEFYISAGGTYETVEIEDLGFQSIESKPLRPETTIYLTKIPELCQIERHERYVEIGAAVTLNKVLEYPKIPLALVDAIKQIGSHAMRNLATIGGNICIPKHKGSLWSVLLALDAKLEISFSKNFKEYKKIIKAYEFTELQENEILSKIRVPINSWNISVYKRLGKKDFNSENSAGFTFLAETEREHIYNIRIAFSGLGELSQHDEIYRHNKRPFHKRVKYGFTSDLIGQKLPLQEKLINSCMVNASKIFSEKCNSIKDPLIEQQFKALLRSSLEKLV